jgi:hypothetical protein
VKNESHDLLLLDRINRVYTDNKYKPYIPNLVYGKGVTPDEAPNGTVEQLTSPVGHVANVHSAKDKLKSYIQPSYTSRPIMGRLHIFKDKPMEFESL